MPNRSCAGPRVAAVALAALIGPLAGCSHSPNSKQEALDAARTACAAVLPFPRDASGLGKTNSFVGLEGARKQAAAASRLDRHWQSLGNDASEYVDSVQSLLRGGLAPNFKTSEDAVASDCRDATNDTSYEESSPFDAATVDALPDLSAELSAAPEPTPTPDPCPSLIKVKVTYALAYSAADAGVGYDVRPTATVTNPTSISVLVTLSPTLHKQGEDGNTEFGQRQVTVAAGATSQVSWADGGDAEYVESRDVPVQQVSPGIGVTTADDADMTGSVYDGKTCH